MIRATNSRNLQVEQLTHKLREYVVARFREATLSTRTKPAVPCYSAQCLQMHEMPADPGSSYIIASAQMTGHAIRLCAGQERSFQVSLRPREQPGSVVSPLPLHYRPGSQERLSFR